MGDLGGWLDYGIVGGIIAVILVMFNRVLNNFRSDMKEAHTELIDYLRTDGKAATAAMVEVSSNLGYQTRLLQRVLETLSLPGQQRSLAAWPEYGDPSYDSEPEGRDPSERPTSSVSS